MVDHAEKMDEKPLQPGDRLEIEVDRIKGHYEITISIDRDKGGKERESNIVKRIKLV
jgi:hypothetical protein